MCVVGQVRLCVCVCVSVCVSVVSVVSGRFVYVCVVRGMPSSCRSAGQSKCVVWGRSVCVCVCVCGVVQPL